MICYKNQQNLFARPKLRFAQSRPIYVGFLKNKIGAMGDGLISVIRIILIAFIALIILGTSAIFYNYYIDVKNTEAFILNTKLVDCVAENGIVDVSKFSGSENDILGYCEINNVDRFLVRIKVFDEEKNEVLFLQQGSGLSWLIPDIVFNGKKEERKGLFENTKYASGYYRQDYGVRVNNNGEESKGYLAMEVLVKHEF